MLKQIAISFAYAVLSPFIIAMWGYERFAKAVAEQRERQQNARDFNAYIDKLSDEGDTFATVEKSYNESE